MSASPLERVRIVLVEPSHPGNVGAAARAMKAMGLGDLALVRPARFPCAEATARAAGADDVLHRALVCETLEEAIARCGWVLATSARAVRRIGWPVLAPRDAVRRAVEEAAGTGVAIVFGREHSGLTNAELDRCHALVSIPTVAGFASLNLGAAVQVVAYELFVAAGARARPARAGSDPPATAAELAGLYAHARAALVDVGYLDPTAPKLLMRRLRRLFGRARLLRSEVNILRGVLKAAQEAAARVGVGSGRETG